MIPKFRAAFKNNILGEVWLIDFIVETVAIPVYDKVDGKYLGGNVWGLNQVTLMQSTGLFDKNGKEIFEGDVVSFSIDDGWDYVVSENGLIIYRDGCYQILENGIKYRINQCLEEDIEVIGNMYENPELMKEAENDTEV